MKIKDNTFIKNLIVNLARKIEKENIEFEKIQNKQNKGEKMLNDMGYKFDYEGSHNTIYSKYVHWLGDAIYFDYFNHKVVIEGRKGKSRDCSMAELEAIYEMCDELGWIFKEKEI